jgi:hypothetical protein
MKNLLVLYGDVVPVDLSRMHVSKCELVNVLVRDMVNIDFAKVQMHLSGVWS